MEYFIRDITLDFFQSSIGILLTTVLLAAALIPGVKFLSRKFDERTDNRIDAKIQPIVDAICSQVSEVTNAMNVHKAATDEAMRALNHATKFLQDIVVSGKRSQGEQEK